MTPQSPERPLPQAGEQPSPVPAVPRYHWHQDDDEVYGVMEGPAPDARTTTITAASTSPMSVPRRRSHAMVEEDGDEVGFTTFDYGCNRCPTEFVDGKPVRQRIEPRGRWMCCVKCGGSYGEVQGSESEKGGE